MRAEIITIKREKDKSKQTDRNNDNILLGVVWFYFLRVYKRKNSGCKFLTIMWTWGFVFRGKLTWRQQQELEQKVKTTRKRIIIIIIIII